MAMRISGRSLELFFCLNLFDWRVESCSCSDDFVGNFGWIDISEMMQLPDALDEMIRYMDI